MKNVELVFRNNNGYKHKNHGKSDFVYIDLRSEKFTGEQLSRLVSEIKPYILLSTRKRISVIIKLGKVVFSDKLTYIILDNIIYWILKKSMIMLFMEFSLNHEHLFNRGFRYTSIFNAMEKSAEVNRQKFFAHYEQSIDTDTEHYRRIISKDTYIKNLSVISHVAGDVVTLLKNHCADETMNDDVSEIIGELINNVFSHTDGDCLLDIDLSGDVVDSTQEENKLYIAINIVVINYSENRLHDRVKQKIENREYEIGDSLYKKIYQAYENHGAFFNENYNEDDFFMITTFQYGVTSRYEISGNSGTGLANLIENIYLRIRDGYSYVLSGKNVIFFRSEFLKFNEERMIGFNSQADYINSAPDGSILARSYMEFPGTAYHVSLIKERENDECY